MNDDDYDFVVDYQSIDSDAISSNSSAKHEFDEDMEHDYEQFKYAEEEVRSPYGSVMGELEQWDREEQEQVQQQVELHAEEEQSVEQEYQRQLEVHLETERELARLAELYRFEHGAEQEELRWWAEAEHQWHLGTYMEELDLRDEQAAQDDAEQVELHAEHDERVEQEYQWQLEQHLEQQPEQWEDVPEGDMLAALDYDKFLQEIQELEERGEEHLQQLGQLYYEQEAGEEEYFRYLEHQARLDNDRSPPPPPSSDPMRPDSTCGICFNSIADTVLIPCGHLVACAVLNSLFPCRWCFVTNDARTAAI